jgi:lipooligosaccharide transport system permease protein
VTTRTLIARTLPPAIIGLRANRIVERNLLVARRAWTVMLSGSLEPIFYLLSVGIGVGSLVGTVNVDGREVSYAAFVAPALLASSAMNGAVLESTYNIFFKLRYEKLYDAMLATPLRPIDIATGEIAYSLSRGGLYSIGFMVVALGFGLVSSWSALLAIPGALLIGFAFGSAGMAATTFMRSWQDFDMVQLVTLPLFLFSATFYPLDVYPEIIQRITKISPLYHGVEIIRAAMLGSFDISLLGHVAFLAVMGAVGLTTAGRRLERLLLT